MENRPAAGLADDLRRVRHVIEVSVREDQQVDLVFREMLGGAHRSVEKDVSAGRGEKKSIGIEGAAGKRFETDSSQSGRMLDVTFDFLFRLCSFCLLESMKSVFRSRMKYSLLLAGVALLWQPGARAETDPGQVAVQVARILEQGHYTRQKLNDEMSQKLLEQYLWGPQGLDYFRLYFLQSDIDEFQQKYGTTLDDSILSGDLTPPPAKCSSASRNV